MNDIIPILVKLLVGFPLILVIFRILRRELSEVTPVDLIAILVIGDMFTGIASDSEKPVWHLLVVLPFWSFLVYLVEVFTTNKKVQKKVEGEPQVLIRDGKIIKEVMDHNRMNELEINMKLRQLGIFSLYDVEIAYLEVNGEITAKEKKQ